MIANQQQMCAKRLLTPRQAEILTGLLLGDGHLETQNFGRTYRLKVEHSAVQEDYVYWLFAEFKDLCDQSKPYRRIRKDGRVSVGFSTRSSSLMNTYAQHFYVARKKRIPPCIRTLLSPIGLAVWFMDDGSRKSLRHKTYNIHTLGYTHADLQIAQEALMYMFGVRTALHRQRNDSWRIYIGAHSAKCFEQIIYPYVLPIASMGNKLIR